MGDHIVLFLGLGVAEKIIYKPNIPRQIKEPYVCIAVQTSGTVKTWLNPTGWNEVVEYLQSLGYRVLCIDKSWLAWACDVPIILISGITAPWCEMLTSYRIYNGLVCHGCHNDTHINWPLFETCPNIMEQIEHMNAQKVYLHNMS